MTTTSCDDDHDWEADSFSMGRSLTVTHSDKRPTKPPMNDFKRLIEEPCPNHTYPVRHKLKDCCMLRSFMTFRDPHLGHRAQLRAQWERYDAVPCGKCHHDGLRGTPPLGRYRVSSLSPRTPTQCGWECGAQGCNDTSFPLP
jgi:hypothetical protein